MDDALSIMTEYMPESEIKKVAQALLLSQDIREESWNDKIKQYEISIIAAVSVATKQIGLKAIWIDILHCWNIDHWNDCQTWAKSIA